MGGGGRGGGGPAGAQPYIYICINIYAPFTFHGFLCKDYLSTGLWRVHDFERRKRDRLWRQDDSMGRLHV